MIKKKDSHITSFKTKDTENWTMVKIHILPTKSFKWWQKRSPNKTILNDFLKN